MQRTSIERAATLAGVRLDPETDVTVVGHDPVLPSRFHLGEGAATALALVGQEASRIWQLRGGRAQSLSANVAHAAASLRSYVFVRVDGASPFGARPIPPVTAIFECRGERFIHLHNSFTHGPGVLAELGLGANAAAAGIAAATINRDAFELEDALAAKGLCAAVCRTTDEWAAHPQGIVLAAKPVIEITRIGDAPPMPFPAAERPLSGVRVLDLTRVLAGPTVARTLAEHGADVLHIAAPHLPTIDAFEMDTGHGKRQAYLDLTIPADSATLRELVRSADIFSQGYQHGSLARRGFGPEELAELRPGIIYVSENAFGHDGPWSARAGWEQLAQATSGITLINNPQRPVLAPAAMNDYTTGYFGALGAMIGLRRRAVEGGSWLVEVSLAQTAMWYLRLGHDLDPAAAPQPKSPSAAFMEHGDTPYGAMDFLRPALGMSETPPRWELPTSPLGSGAAGWA